MRFFLLILHFISHIHPVNLTCILKMMAWKRYLYNSFQFWLFRVTIHVEFHCVYIYIDLIHDINYTIDNIFIAGTSWYLWGFLTARKPQTTTCLFFAPQRIAESHPREGLADSFFAWLVALCFCWWEVVSHSRSFRSEFTPEKFSW